MMTSFVFVTRLQYFAMTDNWSHCFANLVLVWKNNIHSIIYHAAFFLFRSNRVIQQMIHNICWIKYHKLKIHSVQDTFFHISLILSKYQIIICQRRENCCICIFGLELISFFILYMFITYICDLHRSWNGIKFRSMQCKCVNNMIYRCWKCV